MKFPTYLQLDKLDCGPTCLRMIAKYYGKAISIKTLRENSYITREGVSLLGISDAAESIGFHTIGARLSYDQFITDATLPCIVHWRKRHFVVVYKISSKRSFLSVKKLSPKSKWFHIADPAFGLIQLSEDDFRSAWISTIKEGEESGHCLLLEPTPEFYALEDETLNRKDIGYLISHLKSYKGLIFQLILGFVIGSLFTLVVPFLTQAIVDKGINYKDISFITLILIAQLALTLGTVSVNFVRGWIMLHLSTRVNISLISNFLTKLMHLPLAFFNSKMIGDLIQRIGDNSRIQNFLTATFVNIIFSIVSFIIFTCIIAAYNVKIFVVFIIGSALYILWAAIFLKYRRELDNRRFVQASGNQSALIQIVSGMQEIKLNNCEKQKRWEWERIQAMLFKISIKGLMLNQYQGAGTTLINSTKNFIMTFITAKLVIEGEMTLGGMMSIQYILGQLNGPIEQVINFMQSWQDAKISLERLDEIQKNDAEDSLDSYKVIELPRDNTINLKNISFQYEGPHSPYVLEKIDLIIPANQVTAIVGTSGSGKTTLIKLLLGFYPPTEGEISVGNTKLNAINCHVWRQHSGAVMQDGFVFSDTIANNIAVNDEVINKARLYNAVNVANISEFIDSLPLGFNTKIGSEGIGISQGQKQRLLIARVIYKDPSYIFLDEATNALDTNNEKVIMKNLNRFFVRKTVVIVAHRLSTVINADKIIVLDKGKVVEQGKHAELVSLKGAYYNLVRNQLELGN